MMRIVLRTVAAACVLAATACGGSSGSTPEPEPPAPDYDFLTGTATDDVTLDFEGGLPAGASLLTPEGIRLVLQPGTVLRTRRGTRIHGDATLGVDDAGGADALMTTPALHGVVRVWVRVGTDLTFATFDPPAKIAMSLGDWALPGGWTLWTNVRDREQVLGPDPDDLTGPGNDGDPIWLGAVDIEEGALEEIPVRQTGPLGFRFDANPPPTALQPVLASGTVEYPLPGGSGEWPKVYAWKLVNPDTADIIAIGLVDGGMGNGDSQTVSYGGHTYTATVVNDGGGRRLQVTSDVSNVFRVELELCAEDGTRSQEAGIADGGSPNESDTGGTYAGPIEILILGWGGAREEIQVWDEIEDRLGTGESATQDRFAKTGPDGYTSQGRVFGHGGSTQDLADSLPAAWDVQAGNRTITIRIPCPPQTTGVSQTTSLGVSILSAVGYTELYPVPLGVLPLAGAMTSNGDALATASAGRVDLIDLGGPTSQTVTVSGLTNAVALGPFDEVVYAASATGVFTALDLETGAEAWSLATLPVATYRDLAISPDGAFAYATLPSLGEVLEIDLVHRTIGRTFAVPDATAVDHAYASLQLAVTGGVGGVHRLDLVGGSLGPLVPTGLAPTSVVWTTDDEFLLIANTGTSTVTLIDTSAETVVASAPFGPSLVGATAFRDELGMPYGLMVRAGDPLAFPTPIGPAIAVFPIVDSPVILMDTYVLAEEPTFVVVNGR
jgi:DNA-binding beta-propeller fold protein YncE